MLAIGVEKPERMIAGTKNRNAPSNACCCVTASDEIIKPDADRRKHKQHDSDVERQQAPDQRNAEPEDRDDDDQRCLGDADDKSGR